MDGFYGGNGYPNMGMNYGQGMAGYGQGMQQPMGMYDYGNMIRYSKSQILQGLRDYVVGVSNVPIVREEKLEDTPQLLRHACAEAKVSQLGMNQFTVPEMGLSIPFYFCTACGKLFYPKDLMI